MNLLAQALLDRLAVIGPAPGVHRVSEAEIAEWEDLLQPAVELPETLYEECMFARILRGVPGQPGLLLIRFPGDLDLRRLPLHRHPLSNRRVAVLSGRGSYYRVDRCGTLVKSAVQRGDVVVFPRDCVHTFTPDGVEMHVLAVHDPFQWLDDTEILKRAEASAEPV